MWARGMKNGEGKYLYLGRGQVYTGTWVDDVAKCGTVEDVDRDSTPNPPPYPIPQVHTVHTWVSVLHACNHKLFICLDLQCTLEDPGAVLREANDELVQ